MSVVSQAKSSHVELVRRSLKRRASLALKALRFDGESAALALERRRAGEPRALDDLVRALREGAVPDADLVAFLDGCARCACEMEEEARPLVEAVHSLGWTRSSEAVARALSDFTLALLTSQTRHATAVLHGLTAALARPTVAWIDDPPKEQLIAFSRVHRLIAEIVAAVPLSVEILMGCAVDNYPYYKQSAAINRAYLHNMLWIARYIPSLTDRILSLIVNRLIVMDANLRRRDADDEGVFRMELEDNADELADCLDRCMEELFKWIESKGDAVPDAIFSVYRDVVLPTHGTRSIQFIMMFALSLNRERAPEFLDSLWRLVASARVGQSLRQASVAHLAGLLARASYVPSECYRSHLVGMAEWCRSYVKAHEAQSANFGRNPHSVFYCVCQSLFYLVAFDHKNLLSGRKGVNFVESLNLPKIIMSSLNPLRFCRLGVAEAFASVTRMHQIVYCHSVMEHNLRHHLRGETDPADFQEWFPFDPYRLPRSLKWIEPIYKKYEGGAEVGREKKMDTDEDDFLATSPNFSRSLDGAR